MPWSSILILPSGDFKICCFTGHKMADGRDSHGVSMDDNLQPMNVLTHDIMEAMNSKWHKELRLAQSQGKRHDICKVCWDRDDAATTHGVISTSLRVVRSYYQSREGMEKDPDRPGGHPMVGGATLEDAHKWMQPDGSIMTMPLSLDIRFSNLCNSKCLMCEPLYSTLWYEDHMNLTGRDSFHAGPKEYKINKHVSPTGRATYSSDMDVWNNDPRWWAQFDRMAPHLRHIYITGGEPFVQPTHDIFIEKLVERGYAKDIVIEYDTNLSVLNPKILKMLGEFKDQIFRVSTDDVEDRYELIRYPVKWNRIMENLEMMKEYGFHDKIVNLSTCVGVYSIFSPISLYNYFEPKGYKKYFIRILRSPPQVDIAILPRAVKEKVIKIYEQSGLPHFHQTHVVGYLKNNLDLYTDDESRQKLKAFVNYMNSLDRMRGTDWKKTLPDVVGLIQDYVKLD